MTPDSVKNRAAIPCVGELLVSFEIRRIQWCGSAKTSWLRLAYLEKVRGSAGSLYASCSPSALCVFWIETNVLLLLKDAPFDTRRARYSKLG